MWKCPRCSFTSSNYTTMQRHFYSKHYTPKEGSVPKGKQKKKYTFKPIRRK